MVYIIIYQAIFVNHHKYGDEYDVLEKPIKTWRTGSTLRANRVSAPAATAPASNALLLGVDRSRLH
jgi:hypothetical protein